MDRDELLRQLRRQGDRRQAADREREAAMKEIARLAKAAHAAGAKKTEIVREATITRPTLDRMLSS